MLRFNESVQPMVVRVMDRAGIVRATLTPSSGGGTELHLPLPPGLEHRLYVVSYRVTSADSHTVAGSLLFHVGSATTGSTAQAAVLFESAIPWGRIALANRTVWVALAILGGGALLFAGLFRRPLGAPRAVRRVLVGSLLAVLLAVGLQGALLVGADTMALLQRDTWVVGLQSTRGIASLVAAAGLLLLLAAAWRSSPIPMATGLVLLVASFTLSGHAATAQPAWAIRPALFLHVALVLFWIGSLWPLLQRLRHADAVRDLRRFSRIALPAVILLVAAGALLAAAQLPHPAALWESRYGGLLLLKIAGMAVLVVLAALNRLVLVPRFAAGRRRLLHWSIAGELVVGLTLLGVTAVLSQTMPPRSERAMAAPSGFHVVSFTRGRMVDVSLTPARAGSNQIVVAITAPDGAPLVPLEVTAELTLPAQGIEPLVRPLWADGGLFVLDGVPLLAGRWTVRVDALVNDFEKATVAVEVLVTD